MTPDADRRFGPETMPEGAFPWDGKVVNTLGEIVAAMQSVRTPEEAKKFLESYRSVNQYAEQNVGYLTGYLDREEAARLLDLFDVSHPIFGRTIPTPQDAFDAGRRRAAELRGKSS